MAVNTYTFKNLYEAVGRLVYNDEDPDPGPLAECQRIVNEAVLDHYARYDWSYLTPVATTTLWTDIAVDADVTVAASTTTMTATGGTPFYESMLGATITVTDIGTRTITGYTSSTVLTIDSTFATSHTFSFTANGTYGLPDDFGALLDRFTWPDGTPYSPMKWTTPEHIRDLRSVDQGASGDPVWAALSPRAWDSTLGQRWNLEVWPTPTQARTLSYRYQRNPQTMTADAEYPWGGPRHATAIMSAVKAKAEQEKNKVRGPWTEQYEKVDLPRAIQIDQDQGPSVLGPSVGPRGEFRDFRPQVGTLTHNSTEY